MHLGTAFQIIDDALSFGLNRLGPGESASTAEDTFALTYAGRPQPVRAPTTDRSSGSADSFALRNHGMKAIIPQSFPLRAFSVEYAKKAVDWYAANGYIQLKDRSKDIIISGGENISSIEVEDTLYKHPGILEAAVVARAGRRGAVTVSTERA